MRFIIMSSLKNYCWSWITIDRNTKPVLGFVCSRRDTNMFKHNNTIFNNNLNPNNIKLFCSDYWKYYGEVIPKHKHLKSKIQTFTIESYNSRIIHCLARFKRKTKFYSKCKQMLFAVGSYNGSINSDIFHSWVEQILLLETPSNGVMVMDNATF